jgi:integrase/recombinase XerC
VTCAAALDVVEYRGWLQARGAAPATVNRKLAALRRFFGWLAGRGAIPDNPAAGVRPVKAAEGLAPRWLTRREQAALMRAVREKGSARDEAIVGLLLHAGLRAGELCALRREDLLIGERSGKVIVRAGKGNRYREVPLNGTVRKILQRWLEQNPDGALFPNRRGEPMSARSVYEIVNGYAYRARLGKIGPHVLRHTFCKNLLDMGVPMDRVAALAGHGRLEVTRRYTAPGELDLQAAVEKIAWE